MKLTRTKRSWQMVGKAALDAVDGRLQLSQMHAVVLAFHVLQHTVDVALDVLNAAIKTIENITRDALLYDRGCDFSVTLIDLFADDIEESIHVGDLMRQALQAVVQIGELCIRGIELVGIGVGQCLR